MPTLANNQTMKMDDATASATLYRIALALMEEGSVTIETGTLQSQAVIYAMQALKVEKP